MEKWQQPLHAEVDETRSCSVSQHDRGRWEIYRFSEPGGEGHADSGHSGVHDADAASEEGGSRPYGADGAGGKRAGNVGWGARLFACGTEAFRWCSASRGFDGNE